jgi:ABC-2 type transport system ATP-binding protein
VFGFLGPNGAGKTTTIRTLLDLLRPTSGSARVFGLDSRRDSVEIHARVGNLPAEFAFDPRLSGREFVSFLAELRGVSGLGRADLLAERFRADMDRPIGELSRGNRQKLGLVQAAFHAPDLLVLDEPTAGLDPLMQEEFLAFVAEERSSSPPTSSTRSSAPAIVSASSARDGLSRSRMSRRSPAGPSGT